jgi:hypothetical protein
MLFLVDSAKVLVSQFKFAKTSGNPALNGMSDTFLRERDKATLARRSLNITPKNHESPFPMCEGYAFGESISNNRSLGSSGLNLACEALLLGVWRGDRRGTPTKLHLAQPNLRHYRNRKHLRLFC